MVKVLDASALMAYLEKEPGHEIVKDAFVKAAQEDKNLFMSTVNVGEVYYILMRDHKLDEAKKIMQIVQTFPIDFVSVDFELTQQAALYKAQYRLPFVDSFAAALVRQKKAELFTSDKDFRSIAGEIKIVWIK